MSDTKINALKEALSAQQQLLQKLYNELDVEREAASTAASEALSMILRLQGEKAAVKMEAEQYKRLAEEKMIYAEESMEIYEDLVYQKEMEISALDCQVQAFRHKLLCLGYDDPGDDDIDFPDNLLLSEDLVGETSTSNMSGRNFTPLIPPPRLPFIRTGLNERDRSESHENDLEKLMGQVTNDQISGLDKQSNMFYVGNINSYWEQIRKLDQLVREITGEPDSSLSTCDRPHDSMKETKINENDQLKHPDNLLEREVGTNSSSSVIVHDVFEVPETPKILNGEEQKPKEEAKLDGGKLNDEKPVLLDSGKGAKPNLISNEALKQFLTDHAECLDQKLISKNPEPKLLLPASVDCHLKLVQPTTASECTNGLQLANRASEIAEIQRRPLRHDSTMKLLYDLQTQLMSVQSELRTLKLKKSSSVEDLHMRSLGEAPSIQSAWDLVVRRLCITGDIVSLNSTPLETVAQSYSFLATCCILFPALDLRFVRTGQRRDTYHDYLDNHEG